MTSISSAQPRQYANPDVPIRPKEQRPGAPGYHEPDPILKWSVAGMGGVVGGLASIPLNAKIASSFSKASAGGKFGLIAGAVLGTAALVGGVGALGVALVHHDSRDGDERYAYDRKYGAATIDVAKFNMGDRDKIDLVHDYPTRHARLLAEADRAGDGNSVVTSEEFAHLLAGSDLDKSGSLTQNELQQVKTPYGLAYPDPRDYPTRK
jgi:hypothetical protein